MCRAGLSGKCLLRTRSLENSDSPSRSVVIADDDTASHVAYTFNDSEVESDSLMRRLLEGGRAAVWRQQRRSTCPQPAHEPAPGIRRKGGR